MAESPVSMEHQQEQPPTVTEPLAQEISQEIQEPPMATNQSPIAQEPEVMPEAQQSPHNEDLAVADDGQMSRGSTMFDASTNSSRPKSFKLNKIYVGNLPGNTREEDLEGCFGELGKVVSVELKVGYGFVEFENREQAERAVQKYDGGLFLGNKIRCELSHGGGKTSKFAGEPGACFKCRQPGHWARECPNEAVDPGWRDFHRGDKSDRRRYNDAPGRPPPDDPSQYHMRPPVGYRDDYRGDPSSRAPARDYRPEVMPPPVRDSRDFRPSRDLRPVSPPPPVRGYSRDYDDYRGPPRGPPPMATNPYDARSAPDPRGYDGRPPYDLRAAAYGADYDRLPPRDYGPATAAPLPTGAGYDRAPYVTPPYSNGRTRSPVAFDSRREYVPPAAAPYDPYRRAAPVVGPPSGRYDPYSRRRSMSPPPRSAGSSYYEGGPPPAGPYSNGSYRGQPDYPASGPPGSYYDAPNSAALYRGPPGRDDDRRFPDSRMAGYERR